MTFSLTSKYCVLVFVNVFVCIIFLWSSIGAASIFLDVWSLTREWSFFQCLHTPRKNSPFLSSKQMPIALWLGRTMYPSPCPMLIFYLVWAYRSFVLSNFVSDLPFFPPFNQWLVKYTRYMWVHTISIILYNHYLIMFTMLGDHNFLHHLAASYRCVARVWATQVVPFPPFSDFPC